MTPLSACEVGDRVVITRVSDRNEDDLAYLAAVGITPGTSVRIVDVAPFGMITLDVDNTEQAIPEGVATSIRVTSLNDVDDSVSVDHRGDA
jgi:DtxR family Mn-dependent transcriptional regulator